MDRDEALIRYKLACVHLVKFKLSEYSRRKLDAVFAALESEQELKNVPIYLN